MSSGFSLLDSRRDRSSTHPEGVSTRSPGVVSVRLPPEMDGVSSTSVGRPTVVTTALEASTVAPEVSHSTDGSSRPSHYLGARRLSFLQSVRPTPTNPCRRGKCPVSLVDPQGAILRRPTPFLVPDMNRLEETWSRNGWRCLPGGREGGPDCYEGTQLQDGARSVGRFVQWKQ